MINEIKKGDRFLCTKTYLDGKDAIYIAGKIYQSSLSECIDDEEGFNDGVWPLDVVSEYFERIETPNSELDRYLIEFDSSTGRMSGKPVDQSKPTKPKLITRFPSGAVRSDSTGRPRPDWISPYAIEEISKVMVENENEFGACNYMLGIPELACLTSLCRHIGELKEALLITKDMNEARVVARSVGFNITAMLHTMVLKEKGLYEERYERTELVTVEEAKKGNEYLDK